MPPVIARLLTILLLAMQPIPAAVGACAPPADSMTCCGADCCCGGAGACECSSSDETPAPADAPLQATSIELAPTLPTSIVRLPSLTPCGYTIQPQSHRPVVPTNNRRQALLGCWHT